MRVAVIGLGAIGLPAARVLAERGHDVVGVDRHGIASAVGSSAGETRIVRVGHPDRHDVRLAQRAWELWRALEDRGGERLIDPVGLLVRGDAAPAYVAATRSEGGRAEGLTVEEVTVAFPELAPWDVPSAWIEQAGVLFARRALRVQAELARAAGADLREGVRAEGIEVRDDGVRLLLADGTLDVDRLVLAAGPWAVDLIGQIDARLPLAPAIGQVSYWRGGEWERRPALIDYPAGDRLGVYGLPTPGTGYKIGLDAGDEEAWNPEAGGWPSDAQEEEVNADWVRRFAPGLAGDGPHASERCPWTLTPDAGFAIDCRGPVVLAAGCSGHAFKFSPLFGELLADLAEGEPLWPDAQPWSAQRFGLDDAFERVETPLGQRIRL